MGGGTVEERPYLTIVIPVYNESRRLPENLPKVVAYLEGQAYPWEIIIVDDGSEDNTAGIADGFRREEQRISLMKNPHQGKAYAVRTGVLAARGENVFHCDVDLSMPIQELDKLLPPLSGGYDLSIGSRTVRHNFPWHRRLMSWGFRQIVRLFVGAGFKDTQCGFKCYRTEVAKDLFNRTRLYSVAGATVKGPAVTGFDVEVLFLAVKRGYKVKEVPVEWYYSRDSKVNPIKDSLRNLRDVLQVRLNDWRGLYGR